ncbi:MAG: ATP-dependent RNA helicase HrpA [Pseudomonadota bacterium]
MSEPRRRRARHPKNNAARTARGQWQPRLEYPDNLPLTAHRDGIAATIAANPVVIVAGDTGSGKTTQIPKICLELGRGIDGQIALTQPRRLAAHAVGERLADETALPLGAGVGVHVRFDDRSAPSARIRVVTDGILLAELAHDPELRRYDTVIVDEAHERSLNIDFLLGCLKRALARRDDLRVVITSATINTAAFAAFFANAPVIEVAGRSFPIDVRYRTSADDEDLNEAIGAAAASLVTDLEDGDILVFLPGEREILDAQKYLARTWQRGVGKGWEIVPVYGRLPDAEQRRVFRPGNARRVLLATNVAETSLTLPRIRGVIDTGLVRIGRYSARSRIQRLATERVSQASARQRAGRCGRIGPGICVRLYGEQDHAAQPAYTDPEVLRTDLASVALRMLDAGLGQVSEFPWLDAPDPRRIRDAFATLRDVGAIDAKDRLRRVGRQLARLSIDPRLARVLLAAAAGGVLDDALIVVAALSVGDPRLRPPDRRQAADEAHRAFAGQRADFETHLAIWHAWHALDSGQRRWMVSHYLSPRRMFDWRAVHRQLRQQCRELELTKAAQRPADAFSALVRAFVAGFGAHIAKRDADGVYRGVRGARLRLHPASVLCRRNPPWVLGIELVRTHELYIREAMTVKPRWVASTLRHRVAVNLGELTWHAERRRATGVLTTSLDGLVLVRDPSAPLERHDSAAARRLLVTHAIVLDEAELDVAFMDAYRDRLGEIAALEGRVRRPLLATVADRVDWFSARIPASVATLADLTSWLEREPAANVRLTPDLDAIAEHAAADAGLPEACDVGGRRLPLNYVYAPGQANDGVTLNIPAEIANRVRQSEIDAAVPKLFIERIELHLRRLPKNARTRLHPIAESAARFADVLTNRHDDLTFRDRLKLALQAELALDDAAFARWAEVDDGHLVPRVDREAGIALDEPPAPAPVGFDWVFAELPALGNEPPFVALARVDTAGVQRREFRQRDSAEREHAQAVVALLAHAARSPLSLLARGLRERPFIAVRLRDYVEPEGLADRLGELAIDALAPFAERSSVRTQAEFDRLADRVRGSVAASAERVIDELDSIATLVAEIGTALGAASVPVRVADDVAGQLARLLPDTFPQSQEYKNFINLPRYLKAILYRLDKLGGRLVRDREAQQTVQRLTGQLDRLPAAVATTPAAFEYRWALEELRVSLFAEPLGTAYKVSPRRLEKLWQRVIERS